MTIKQQWEALDLLQECRLLLSWFNCPSGKYPAFVSNSSKLENKIRTFQKKVSKRRNMGKQI